MKYGTKLRNIIVTDIRVYAHVMIVRLLRVLSHVRESKEDLDSGFHVVDYGFQVLDSGRFLGRWNLDSGIPANR